MNSIPSANSLLGCRTCRKAVLWAGIAVVLVLPFWIVAHPPLLDYPNHLASIFVLAHLHDPAFNFDQYYGADWRPRPYLLVEALLLGMAKLMPIGLAGKLILSASVLALPFSTWFFLRTADPGLEAMAAWPLLVVFNPFLLMGFFTFQLGVALSFLFLGLWIRYLRAPSRRRWVLLLLLAQVLYLTHLYAFVAAGFIVLVYPLVAQCKVREIAASWGMFIPGVILNLISGSPVAHLQPVFVSWREKLLGLPTPLLGHSYELDLVTVFAVAACALVLLYKNQELRWNRAWLVVVLGMCAVYFAAPSGVGLSSEADRRLLLFTFVIALASVHVGRRARLVLPVVLLLFLIRMGGVVHDFVSEQTRLQAWERSFSVLSRDCRLLPLVEADSSRFVHRTYMHFASYAVIERGCFSPYLFTIPEIHPLRITRATYLPRSKDESDLLEPDWPSVARDYDYVWAFNVSRFAPQLRSLGTLTYQDKDLQVYRIPGKSERPQHY